jgi:hypothetical protein
LDIGLIAKEKSSQELSILYILCKSLLSNNTVFKVFLRDMGWLPFLEHLASVRGPLNTRDMSSGFTAS